MTTPALLRQRRLDHLADLPGLTARGVAGPDGGRGLLIGCHGEQLVRYAPDVQTWTAGPRPEGDQPAFWMGRVNDAELSPDRFARAEQVAGHPTRLADGNDWTVPIIRSSVAGSALPQRMVLDERGEWSSRPLEVYARHQQDAERVWTLLMATVRAANQEADDAADDQAPESVGMTVPALADVAVRVLGINYTLGAAEVGWLGLFDTRTPERVAMALVDWPTVLRIGEQVAAEGVKKKAGFSASPAGNSTGGGGTA